MPSDYEAITRKNEKELGTKTSTRKAQVCMYSDSTHFIYEILQNSDDYGATEVQFILRQDELIIEHNGNHTFQTNNVLAITSFGESTSESDLTKTGRFGVGFKSVFAFTASPSIYSGDEDFQIYGLYRICTSKKPEDLSKNRTRIVLPFDHAMEKPDYVEKHIPAKEAYKKIEKRLATLNMDTLLFTKNIREVFWETETQKGHYLREDKIKDGFRTTRITDGNALSNYLVFSRTPVWRGKEYKDVEIAFGLDEKDRLKRLSQAKLFVLFATTQEPRFQFIINGPFRTTPSRESISEDDNFNHHLIKELCALIKELLPSLRDSNRLSYKSLEVFPVVDSERHKFYEPIREAVVEAFNSEPLVPTVTDIHETAQNVALGPAKIRECVDCQDLFFLSDEEFSHWAKGGGDTPADKFLKSLGIAQWGWDELQEALHIKFRHWFGTGNRYYWLSNKKDGWLRKLYLCLGRAIQKGDCNGWRLSRCRIIRVKDSGKETYASPGKAYFPRRGFKELPQIKREILKGKNQKETKEIEVALVALGVSEIGDNERIDLILETYYGGEKVEVTQQQNLQHMEIFVKWWHKSRNSHKFRSYPIFLSTGGKLFHKGEDCYLDKPLRKSGLDVIYGTRSCPLESKEKMWAGYRKISVAGFCDHAIACGAIDCLAIKQRRCDLHPYSSQLKQDYYQWGVRYTNTAINLDFFIEGLKALLKLGKREVNQLIWYTVSKADPEVLEAAYRPNQQYATRRAKSSLVIALSKTAWIPNKRGTRMIPSKISKDQLHPSFKYDNRNGWLDEIGFGEEAKKASTKYQKTKEMAEGLGIPVEMAEYFDELSDEDRKKEFTAFKALISRKKAARKKQERMQKENISYNDALSNAFNVTGNENPNDIQGNEGTARKPSRRRAKTKEEIVEAIENEGRTGARFTFNMRKKWKGKNDRVRTALAEWYGGKCQICGKTFTQRSGEPYFEGLYLVSYTKAEWLDRIGNVLCLCPWHSAMFQYGDKKVNKDILEQISMIKLKKEGGDGKPFLSISLCDHNVRISYAENHILDLQEMIKADQGKSTVGAK